MSLFYINTTAKSDRLLAIVLAAKSTLEDFFGALKLYADRPVRVGDLCRFDEESNPLWLSLIHITEPTRLC